MKIVIIGAGIGGLTTAIALQQKGFSAIVYEAADILEPAGAGIILANNAMQVYSRLGLSADIQKKGCKVNQLILTDPELEPLSVSDLSLFERQFGVHGVAIHRADLQTILLRASQPSINVELGKRLQIIEQQGTRTKLIFADKTSAVADVIIGADGIHSIVRNDVQPDAVIRRPKQVCWRGITEFRLPDKYRYKLQESWGAGLRFGFTQINADQVYWYALHNYKANYVREFSGVNVAALYQSFHPIVSQLIRLTPADRIIFNEILDLKPLSSWFLGNLGLMGDAAHATTPNLGQGACQAIEDAYLLAELFAKELDYTNVFPRFNNLRKNKVDFVVNTSWRLGRMAHIESTFGCRVRNMIMRLMPNELARQQNSRLFTLAKVE